MSGWWVLDATRGGQPRAGGWGGGGDDSHLQQPRGVAAGAAAGTAVALAVSRLLSVSAGRGSVDMEETSLAEEEGVEAWCWWCCWGLLLTVAPVLWTLAVL